MNRQQIFDAIMTKRSFLCVGLDTDISRIPPHLMEREDPVFEFNKQIIDATKEHCIAYKPNLAFYEALGADGWRSLERTVAYIPEDLFVIADAKRGDIGNTTQQYAEAFFNRMDVDAITVSPYMGRDSVTPFFDFRNKWVILLALTSNPSSSDLELLESKSGKYVYEELLTTSREWGSPDQLMYVVGATQAEKLREIRKIIPDHYLLVPGVGAQGGSLEEVVRYGINAQCGLIVNSSRGIIYAGTGENFAEKAGEVAAGYQDQMDKLLKRYL